MSLRVDLGGGDEYSIRWEHQPHKYKTIAEQWGERLPGTDCVIEWHKSPKEWVPVNTGYAILHPNDRFDKEKGRKVSLARALENWPREKRKLIWESYFNRKGAGDCR